VTGETRGVLFMASVRGRARRPAARRFELRRISHERRSRVKMISVPH
jgi:hypothetical protein